MAVNYFRANINEGEKTTPKNHFCLIEANNRSEISGNKFNQPEIAVKFIGDEESIAEH